MNIWRQCRFLWCALTLLPFCLSSLARGQQATSLADSIERGKSLSLVHCVLCHGVTGDGLPGVYPPLVKSDWLAANRSDAIRAIVAGLKDEITVNGQVYRGQMPPIMLDDAQAADVLTFALNSWGNPGGRVAQSDVTAIRSLTGFKTFDPLKAAGDYRPLPQPPPGFTISELVRLTEFGVRLASDGRGGKFYILGQAGGVWRFDPVSGNLKQILWPKDFVAGKPGKLTTFGMVRDAQGGLWISANHRVDARPLVMNEVTIFRTTDFDADGNPVTPQPWFQTRYPWGLGPFSHGVSDLRIGPDGIALCQQRVAHRCGRTGRDAAFRGDGRGRHHLGDVAARFESGEPEDRDRRPRHSQRLQLRVGRRREFVHGLERPRRASAGGDGFHRAAEARRGAAASRIPLSVRRRAGGQKMVSAYSGRARRDDVRPAGREPRPGGNDGRQADQHVQRAEASGRIPCATDFS